MGEEGGRVHRAYSVVPKECAVGLKIRGFLNIGNNGSFFGVKGGPPWCRSPFRTLRQGRVQIGGTEACADAELLRPWPVIGQRNQPMRGTVKLHRCVEDNFERG